VKARRVGGFSLIELLVAVAIGLVVTLVAFRVLVDSEGRKRTSTSLNDANQSGAYAAYVVDRTLRGAGTGFAQSWARVGGCRLNAVLPAGEALPRVNALPAPFTAIPQTVRLAPVVIFPGASDTGTDVLMVMSGSAGFGEGAAFVQPGSVTATQVQLPNSIGYRAGDLMLLSAGGECLLTEVSPAKAACAGDPASPTRTTACTPIVGLGGTYYTPTATFTSLAALSTQADLSAMAIGNTTTNRPQFQLIGVGANTTLFSHDLLMLDGQNVPQPLAEGVRELHALYGVDTDSNGTLDAWQAPTGVWAPATLMDGSAASNTRLRQIVAVRVGMVIRSSLIERDIVAPDTLTLFGDLGAGAVTVDLTQAGENRNQRHRTIELTIPLRNFLLRT
jgi:type IV pilus assembly protein PilW